MSLFGAQPAQTGGLFGKPPSGGVFGSSTATGGGLFGQQQGQQQQQQQNTGASLFGQSTQQPSGTGLFGDNSNKQPQSGGGLFGNNSNQQNTTSTGLFGQSTNPDQRTGAGIFGNANQQNQNQSTGGLFGQQQQNQNTSSLFGQQPQQQQQNAGSSLFGQAPTQQNSLFGQTPQANASGFGAPQLTQSQQPSYAQSLLGPQQASLWQQNEQPQGKSVDAQMMTILEKWDPSSPNCVFKYYFYNKVDDNKAPFYGPSPNEDPKEWEEALSKKPGPGYIPALCTGFKQMGERIIIQQKNLAHYNAILHEINQALDAMLTKHDTETSIRALNAKRKHIALRQRSLALATKVQILRNRGYAMDGAEEALKAKLQKLEKTVCDPALNARGEEIWARMVGVRERARVLKDEMNKVAQEESIDAETQRRAEKILEDYARQLEHLTKETRKVTEEFRAWLKEQGIEEPKLSKKEGQ